MIEFKQISHDVIEVVGVYGEVSIKLGCIYTEDYEEPLFEGLLTVELEQILAKMKEIEK